MWTNNNYFISLVSELDMPKNKESHSSALVANQNTGTEPPQLITPRTWQRWITGSYAAEMLKCAKALWVPR